MIVLNVTYKCKAGMREKFLDKIIEEGIDVASRAEDGNCKYDYYTFTGNETELLLVEKWRDDDALNAHKEQAHYKRLGVLKNEFVEETILEIYRTE